MATKSATKKPKVKKEGAVRVSCASAEVILAIRAYLGGVKSGLGPRAQMSEADRGKLRKLQSTDRKLGAMQRRLSRAVDQSRSVTVVFNKDLDT